MNSQPEALIQSMTSETVRSVRDLQLALHFVTALNEDMTGVAAVFSRNTVQEASHLLRSVTGLKVASPILPRDFVFRQWPKSTRFDAVSIIER